MRVYKSPLPVILGMLLIASCFFACGGGEGRSPGTPVPVVIVPECSHCHGKDTADSHYDAKSTKPLEGYVFDTAVAWAPEGMGYVLRTGENACAASCHSYHDGDISINNKWRTSGHADLRSDSFAYDFSDGSCLRCHSGVGFASYVDATNPEYPAWIPPSKEIYPHFITCNACHDGEGYPTAKDKRLRKTGSVVLTSGNAATFVQDALLDVGDSASCVVCHQGMESGWSLFRTMQSKGVDPYDGKDEVMTGISFVNAHYAAAASMLFSRKGYEFSSRTYSKGLLLHQLPLCTGCHMAPAESQDLGGHSFNMRRNGYMNVAACQSCHPGLTDFGTFFIYERDMDGDGMKESIKDEIEGLKELLIGELENAGIYYNPHVYPYFFKVPAPQIYPNRVTIWKESQLEAAFNLDFVAKEPGAYIHNFRYAVQLLRDSYEALTGRALAGIRPSSSDDRPAAVYSSP
ncbi:MAG: hypothetical protein AB1552_02475 [Nitrospirota bacterium]